MEENQTESIKALRQAIERSVRRPMRTPKDFAFLRECIFARLRENISETTLKRIWGYIPGGEPRPSTLSQLAFFLGYESWEEFVKANADAADMCADTPSGFILGRHINVLDDLRQGDRLRLIWQPDRECAVRYLGGICFEVEASANTRLQPGDTFSCAFIMEGEPLYLDGLRQEGRDPAGYICGSRSGIRFEPI